MQLNKEKENFSSFSIFLNCFYYDPISKSGNNGSNSSSSSNKNKNINKKIGWFSDVPDVQ